MGNYKIEKLIKLLVLVIFITINVCVFLLLDKIYLLALSMVGFGGVFLFSLLKSNESKSCIDNPISRIFYEVIYNILKMSSLYVEEVIEFMDLNEDFIPTGNTKEKVKDFKNASEKIELTLKEMIAQKNNASMKIEGLREDAFLLVAKVFDVFRTRSESINDVFAEYRQYKDFFRGDSLHKLIIEYECMSRMFVDLLDSVKGNIKQASDPLSGGVYEIKSSIHKFLDKVAVWERDFTDSSSNDSFVQVVNKFADQERSFNELSNIVEKTITDLKREFTLITGMVDRIAENTKSVEDIASKIKTLSLNASIEAARAGEAGKGFKVIANETKKLSEQTNDLLKNIVLEVENTKSTTGIVMKGLGEGYDEIIGSIDEQKSGIKVFEGVLENYRGHVNNIFTSIHDVVKRIFSQVDTISPTFQLHDLMTQEVDNISHLFKGYVDRHGVAVDTIRSSIEEENTLEIIDKFLSSVEEQITTDNEVDIVAKYIKEYGIHRDVEVKSGDMDIELF